MTIAPGPKGAFLLGSLPLARRDPLRMVREAFRDHGDVARLTFGPAFAHLLRHPDHLKLVLQAQPADFSRQTRGFANLRLLVGEGLIASEGPHWMKQRKIAQPAFHKQRIAAFASLMTGAVRALVDGWSSGQELDVAAEMMRLTLRIVSETLLGVNASDDAAAVSLAFTDVLHFVASRATQLVPLPPQWPTPGNRRFARAKVVLDGIIYRLIAERRGTSAERDDLLSLFQAARDEDTGEGMSDVEVRDEVLTMFLAGHETTGTLLAWALWLIARHPDVRARIEAEADALGRLPEFDDLPKLAYVRQVIDETLRLYPPAWMVPRRAEKDCEIGGFSIPAKSLVLLSAYAAHRNPAYWDRPEEFDPTRFAPELVAVRPRWAYLPFGGGPHQCIGNMYALVEAQLVVAGIAQRFRLEALDAVVEPEPMVTLRPRGGIRVRLHQR